MQNQTIPYQTKYHYNRHNSAIFKDRTPKLCMILDRVSTQTLHLETHQTRPNHTKPNYWFIRRVPWVIWLVIVSIVGWLVCFKNDLSFFLFFFILCSIHWDLCQNYSLWFFQFFNEIESNNVPLSGHSRENTILSILVVAEELLLDSPEKS